MNDEKFQKVLHDTFSKVEGVLNAKADEYSDDFDRLYNFKKSAHMKSESPQEALAGMMIKHTVSIYDLLLGGTTPPIEVWDEKIIDHINYLILARAVVLEKLEGDN